MTNPLISIVAKAFPEAELGGVPREKQDGQDENPMEFRVKETWSFGWCGVHEEGPGTINAPS
ncbi:MAG: hypothetical protein LWX11_00220 [Firmicutes bacterium]|nr:hypothetical protein [Bacillota bacterium]